MQERFKELIDALGGDEVSVRQKLEIASQITGRTWRNLGQKYYGESPVREEHILSAERCVQIHEDRLIVLIARGLCRAELMGRNAPEMPTASKIRTYVENHYDQFVKDAEKIVRKSVFG